jgi:hypothetical protein
MCEQINPMYILEPYFLKVHFDIVVCMPMSAMWSLHIRFTD